MNPETLIRDRNQETRASSETVHQEMGATALQLTGKEQVQDFELKDKRIIRLTPIYSPAEVVEKIPQTSESAKTVKEGRDKIVKITDNEPTDDRLLVIIGPCSIHDPAAALEYADWVKEKRETHKDDLEIVMRTYLEKPRTTTGWKGLINDPHMDGSFAMNEGLVIARDLLHEITKKGVPLATELLDTSTPQYLDDMISYGAIGARTTESQLHRQLASGTSFPVGFKNGTGGSIDIAINAIKSAGAPHSFIGIDKDGTASIVETAGNQDCHIILRGSSTGPNYDAESVRKTSDKLSAAGLTPAIIIDVSHANSRKDYLTQYLAAQDIGRQLAKGNTDIRGVMIESNLEEGAQDAKGKSLDELVYGQSITDACVGLGDSGMMLDSLAESVRHRRKTI